MIRTVSLATEKSWTSKQALPFYVSFKTFCIDFNGNTVVTFTETPKGNILTIGRLFKVNVGYSNLATDGINFQVIPASDTPSGFGNFKIVETHHDMNISKLRDSVCNILIMLDNGRQSVDIAKMINWNVCEPIGIRYTPKTKVLQLLAGGNVAFSIQGVEPEITIMDGKSADKLEGNLISPEA